MRLIGFLIGFFVGFLIGAGIALAFLAGHILLGIGGIFLLLAVLCVESKCL